MGVVRSKTGSKQFVAGAALAIAVVAAASAAAKEDPSTKLQAFRPEADTYVSAAQPQENFGRSRSLRADGSPHATTYIRFRLNKLKDEVASVTLLLHARAGARARYEVRRARRDEWGERGMTYENAPRLSLRYTSSKPVRRGVWSAVDVTSFVTDDSDRVSLAITTRSSLAVVFESRESKQGPRLVVRTRDDDGMEEQEPEP